MNLVAALRGLRGNPLDPNSPPLLVAEGDLTPDDEAKLTAYKHPYALVLGLPENVRGGWLNGDQNVEVTLDVVLEQRSPDGKTRPHKGQITALRNQVLRLPRYVDELTGGIPLQGPLVYLSGTHPASSFTDNTTLTATVRFRARWRMIQGD